MSLHGAQSPMQVELAVHTSCLIGSLQSEEDIQLSNDPALMIGSDKDDQDSISITNDLSDCDASVSEKVTDEASEMSGKEQDDEEQPEQAQDSAQAYFQELTQLRNCRKRGVLIVRCSRESTNASVYKRLMEDYRDRRNQRLKMKGVVPSSSAPRIRFDSLTIHEFPMILGDNPGCYMGPPLSISWEPQETLTLPIDEFEATRPPRRMHAQMIIPSSMREEILRRAGYGRNEIIELTKPVNITRRYRKRTKETQNLDTLSFACERVLRMTRHAVTLGYKKRQERRFLEPYVQFRPFPLSNKGDLSNSISSTVALEISEEMAKVGQ